ncbi:serine/threonine-protein kinase [Rubripirellula tenax]|nr:serine/threonine-protein kinase [Rubripirellula tenax]
MRFLVKKIETALVNLLTGPPTANHAPMVTPSSGTASSTGPASLADMLRSLTVTDHPTARLIRRIAPWVVMLMAIGLVAAAILVGYVLRESTRQLVRDSLRSNLSANVAALNGYFAERRREVDRIANDPAIAETATELISASSGRFEWTIADLPPTSALDSIDRSIDSSNTVGWALLDRDDQVIAASATALVGRRLPIPESAKQRVISGGSTICLPFQCSVGIRGDGPMSVPDWPMMAALGKVESDGKMVGTMAVLVDPAGAVSKLLAVARLGTSGETYLFDRNATMLTRSRFEHQLRAAGRLASEPNVTSANRIAVCVPGVETVRDATGSPAAADQSTKPIPHAALTLMADQATRGGTGDNVTGYPDYRGVDVVGAWTWLPQYEMGIASEMDAAEAYVPIRMLGRLVIGMLALATLMGAILVTLAIVLRRAYRRIAAGDDAQRRIGHYRLGESLGRGGMGAVFRAEHDLLKRIVAIKVLDKESQSSVAVSRFEREAQMTAGLRHPNTISLFDFGQTDRGDYFYVMEYVEGITLQSLVNRFGHQPPARVIHLLLQICGSLSEAHAQGIIHRDIKPANLMISTEIGSQDTLKVLDFGLVKDVDPNRGDLSLTTADGITGTPMYMAPETVRDATTSNHRSDIYAVGGVGYTLLVGKPMFEGDASVDICLKQLREDPIRPSDRIGVPLPDDLQNVLMSCLSKDPKFRPSSIEDLATSLHQCCDAGKWDDVDAKNWWSLVLNGAFIDDRANRGDATTDDGATSPSEGDASVTAH